MVSVDNDNGQEGTEALDPTVFKKLEAGRSQERRRENSGCAFR